MSILKDIESKLTSKGLSPSSIKIYVRNLEKLHGDDEVRNLNFLKDVDKILTKLEKFKPNTRRTYLISIVSCLGVCSDNKVLSKLHKTYQEKMMGVDGEIKKSPADGKSDTQKKNWVDWEEVLSTLEELKSKVDFRFKKL